MVIRSSPWNSATPICGWRGCRVYPPRAISADGPGGAQPGGRRESGPSRACGATREPDGPAPHGADRSTIECSWRDTEAAMMRLSPRPRIGAVAGAISSRCRRQSGSIRHPQRLPERGGSTREEGAVREALRLCRLGIDYTVTADRKDYVPDFLWISGDVHRRRGDLDPALKDLDESVRLSDPAEGRDRNLAAD